MTVAAVWNIADIFNALMAFPNLIALLALSGVVVKETKDFFKRHKKLRIRNCKHAQTHKKSPPNIIQKKTRTSLSSDKRPRLFHYKTPTPTSGFPSDV